jgi:transposase
VPVEQRLQLVLSVLSGQMTMAEAARRHGVSPATVSRWRDRFLEAGKGGLQDELPGPDGSGSDAERRLRRENEQLKLALAEATVQLRVWQHGADLVDQIPSKTSRR